MSSGVEVREVRISMNKPVLFQRAAKLKTRTIGAGAVRTQTFCHQHTHEFW